MGRLLPVAINLKSERADRLARELAALTGETLTDAVTTALDERLTRERKFRGDDRERRRRAAQRIVEHFNSLPVLDDRTADEIIGYGDDGLPS